MAINTGFVTEPEKQGVNFNKLFRKDLKIKYSRKLSGKVRLYVSEKNALKSIGSILTIYEHSLN